MARHKNAGKFTKAQERKAAKRAEQLKGKPGIRNPFATAAAQIKKEAAARKRKRK